MSEESRSISRLKVTISKVSDVDEADERRNFEGETRIGKKSILVQGTLSEKIGSGRMVQR
ncbi:MAG: hypothetical protein HY567_00550 [Candidatus Kerfeldbacteria bacterium]|nr:hypothetical protein [Candidatus Kerfeldbacteria bacterium]